MCGALGRRGIPVALSRERGVLSKLTFRVRDRRLAAFRPIFNMSRTLSIGKIGPGLRSFELGQALSLSQPSCGDLGVSFRRSSLQFNIRPWRIRCWAIRCYGWGYLVDSTVCVRGWRLGRSQKKRLGFAPTASDRTAGWDVMRYVGSGLRRSLAVLDHAAYRPAPARELARRRDVGLVLVDAALEHRGPPADEPSHALGGVAPRARGPAPGPWPGPSNAGEHPR